jgi:eukaryotic-like serine/threonine-protein kinase
MPNDKSHDKPEPVRRSKEEQRLLDIADAVGEGGSSDLLADVLKAFSAREEDESSPITLSPTGEGATIVPIIGPDGRTIIPVGPDGRTIVPLLAADGRTVIPVGTDGTKAAKMGTMTPEGRGRGNVGRLVAGSGPLVEALEVKRKPSPREAPLPQILEDADDGAGETPRAPPPREYRPGGQTITPATTTPDRPFVREGVTLVPDMNPTGRLLARDVVINELSADKRRRDGGDDGSTQEKTPSSSRHHGEPATHKGALADVAVARTLTRRYAEIGTLGSGGMGEVFRVLDRDLNRTLALKAIRRDLMENPRALSRFVSEAQVTGQLQHPGIVPVHDIGRLPDGRMYFAMQEVRGRELGDVIREVHDSRTAVGWEPAPSGWTFRRLIDAFLKVCEAVAYAHVRKVIHRDIKPENILIGEYGEVLVLDWGLARVTDEDIDFTDDLGQAIVTDRARDGRNATVAGAIAGTPAYMPPEQARGDRDAQGTWSDVWSLGAVLYEILAGHAPYVGPDAEAILAMVTKRDPIALPTTPDIPEALRLSATKALQRDPRKRHRNAGELAEDINGWIEGSKRREAALLLVRQAEERSKSIGGMAGRAAALRAEADRHLATLHPTESVELKKLAWRRFEEARGLERGADVLETVAAQLASAALVQVTDLPEAHAFLADHYQKAHARAESRGNDAAAERHRTLLQAHDNGRHAKYLAGDGTITLLTDPDDATVEMFRYVERDRMMVLEPFGKSLKTPIRAMPIPMGSYLFTLRAPNRHVTRYPVHIRRGEHWEGISPDTTSTVPVYLPSQNEIEEDEIYVAPGWFWAGIDVETGTPRAKVWLDGFVIQRYCVTNQQYVEFLNDLLRKWRNDDAQRFAPWPHVRAFAGAMQLNKDRSGHFALPPDVDGDPIGRDWPVSMVDWNGAVAYAQWASARDGKPWTLPYELEWEKAARGVDGRMFPMGPHLDPTWTCMGDSHLSRPMHASIEAHPEDESPYGVCGMAGNVRVWCRDRYTVRGPRISSKSRIGLDRQTAPIHGEPVRRAVRGGSWMSRAEDCATTWRNGFLDDEHLIDVGFRLVRALVR